MQDPLEGIDYEILNEAIRFGLEFMEEAERRQRQVQAKQPQQMSQPLGGPPPPQHPARKNRSKKRRGRR